MHQHRKILFLFFILFFIYAPGKAQNEKTTIPGFRTADLFFLTPEKQLEYYQKADQLLSTNKIAAGKKKYPLIEAPVDLSGFSFKYKDTLRTVDDFMKQTNVVG
jgi:hypothetical protein